MRLLCLPGAFGSSEKFQIQLAPLLNELKNDENVSFFFTQGPHEAVPPPGYEDFFGGPPFYRFLEGSKDPKEDALTKIRDMPEGASPEDTLRLLNQVTTGSEEAAAGLAHTAAEATKFVFDVIEKEGPFDGVIGYSEGAIIAGTVVLREQELYRKTGRKPSLKLAVFFAGWPPIKPDFSGMLFSDESDLQIPVATCHVIGSQDPYLDGSMALYNVCDPDTAVLFDHSKGHTLPRDRETILELADTLRNMIADIIELEQAEHT